MFQSSKVIISLEDTNMMLSPRRIRNLLDNSYRSQMRRQIQTTAPEELILRTEISPVMTRFELLHLLVAQARANGFEFRKWYIAKLGLPWETTRQAVDTLCAERRYYALLFSHDFASTFWKAGERITFQVPTQTFLRRKADGTIGTVNRKAYTRRSTRDDAWRYHLRELAIAEEPLRYMRRYLRIDEDIAMEDDELEPAMGETQAAPAGIAIVQSRLT